MRVWPWISCNGIAPALRGAAMLLIASATTGVMAAPPKPVEPVAPPKPAALTCTLLTLEAPRGGRLEVEGQGLGKVPLVRIGGKVTRTIERTETRIAVQIPANSDGGDVTVVSGKLSAHCGKLTIIGRD